MKKKIGREASVSGEAVPCATHAQETRAAAPEIGDAFYAEMTDVQVARHINLALLMNDGISEQDFGFDRWPSLNDAGLAAITRIVGRVRAAAISKATSRVRAESDAHGTADFEAQR